MVCRSNSWVFLTSDLHSSRTLWLLSPKWKWHFHEITKVFIFFIIFWAFLAPRLKTSPLKLSVFSTWRKNCKIWWKKIFPHEKRRKKKKPPFTVSVSRFIWLEKKETTSLEADVDTVSVVEDGKRSLEPLWLQGRYRWPLEFLWLSIFTADKTVEKPKLWY